MDLLYRNQIVPDIKGSVAHQILHFHNLHFNLPYISLLKLTFGPKALVNTHSSASFLFVKTEFTTAYSEVLQYICVV